MNDHSDEKSVDNTQSGSWDGDALDQYYLEEEQYIADELDRSFQKKYSQVILTSSGIIKKLAADLEDGDLEMFRQSDSSEDDPAFDDVWTKRLLGIDDGLDPDYMLTPTRRDTRTRQRACEHKEFHGYYGFRCVTDMSAHNGGRKPRFRKVRRHAHRIFNAR